MHSASTASGCVQGAQHYVAATHHGRPPRTRCMRPQPINTPHTLLTLQHNTYQILNIVRRWLALLPGIPQSTSDSTLVSSTSHHTTCPRRTQLSERKLSHPPPRHVVGLIHIVTHPNRNRHDGRVHLLPTNLDQRALRLVRNLIAHVLIAACCVAVHLFSCPCGIYHTPKLCSPFSCSCL